MILVDTSIWIGHLRKGNNLLSLLLLQDLVLMHPFIIGELTCGPMVMRHEIMGLLESLPAADTAEHAEVLQLVGAGRLHGLGIGWIDAHLLASSRLSHALLWTSDRQLNRGAMTGSGVFDDRGVLGIVRHPWYVAVFILLWTSDLNAAAVTGNLVLSGYLVVGTLLEGRKLVIEFGEEYRRYQRRVSMFIPVKWLTARLNH